MKTSLLQHIYSERPEEGAGTTLLDTMLLFPAIFKLFIFFQIFPFFFSPQEDCSAHSLSDAASVFPPLLICIVVVSNEGRSSACICSF